MDSAPVRPGKGYNAPAAILNDIPQVSLEVSVTSKFFVEYELLICILCWSWTFALIVNWYWLC